MLVKSLWLTPFLCLTLLQPANEDKAKKDLERMQGKWVIHVLELNGMELPVEQADDIVLTVKGNDYRTTKKKDQKLFQFRIKLDPSKDPKTIDFIQTEEDGTEKVFKGIYAFEKDMFKMSRGLNAAQERPAQFASMEGSNSIVVTWKKPKQ